MAHAATANLCKDDEKMNKKTGDMHWWMVSAALLVFAVSWGAFALTGSDDSATGALETVRPGIESLTVTSGASIEVSFTEPMLGPGVTTADNYAVSGLGAGTLSAHPTTVDGTDPYTLSWTSGDMVGTTVTVTVTGLQDLVGNPIDPEGDSASGMGIGAKVPLYAWPLALALLAAGLLVLARCRRRTAVLLLLLAALTAAPLAFAQAPTVSNAAFAQNPNGIAATKVDITYDLVAPTGPCNITVSLSKNGGADGFVHRVTAITGDVSRVGSGTGLHIVWNIAADYPDESIPQARLRVTADDSPVEMVSVPEEAFTMGRTSEGDDALYGQANELPMHSVMLSSYQIGKYEVTNQQYCDVLNWAIHPSRNYLRTETGAVWTGTGDLCAGANLQLIGISYDIVYSGGVFSVVTRTGLPEGTSYSMADHPVVAISWYGAVAFCNWLSEMRGLTPCYDMTTAEWPLVVPPPNAGGYRLPTEAEWERAAAWDASMGKHWIYAIQSDTLTGWTRANYAPTYSDIVNPLGLYAPYDISITSPVGWFNGINISPNGGYHTVNSRSPVGCYDMTGNAWELCNDRYGAYTATPQTNPTGPTTGAYRVVRGGGFLLDNANCRTACRPGQFTDSSRLDAGIGFRAARTP